MMVAGSGEEGKKMAEFVASNIPAGDDVPQPAKARRVNPVKPAIMRFGLSARMLMATGLASVVRRIQLWIDIANDWRKCRVSDH